MAGIASARLATVPLRHTLPGLLRDPLGTVERLGGWAGGRVVRINLGLFRPYLVTSPDHVQHVLRDHGENYRRDGMMWRPLQRFFGAGLGGDGPAWEPSRRLIQPLFSARRVARHLDTMAASIDEAMAELSGRHGQCIDAEQAMTRIVYATVVRLFFGARIDIDDAQRLGQAISTVFSSVAARMVLPFVSGSVPLPGDRALRRAVQTADAIVLPVVRQCRAELAGHGAGEPADIASLLCQVRNEAGHGLDDRQVRDDMVAMFGGGTETTVLALTWLWVVLDGYPEVAQRLYAEIEAVVGAGPVRPEHLPGLSYTKMVLQELLRLYPVGWIIPRTVAADDTIGGVRVRRGDTVVLSPYLTQRLPHVWPDPLVFDPQRFAAVRSQQRHRFAYFPFSGGAHQCLGEHLFTVEAALITAALLSRFRPRLAHSAPKPKAAVSLRPDGPVKIILHPARPAPAS